MSTQKVYRGPVCSNHFTWPLARFKNSFSHPDFTVGSGVSPDPPLGY